MVEEISTGCSQHISKIATGFLAYSGFGVSTYYPNPTLSHTLTPIPTPTPTPTPTHTCTDRALAAMDQFPVSGSANEPHLPQEAVVHHA